MSTRTIVLYVLCFTAGTVFRSVADLGGPFIFFIILLGGTILLLSRFTLRIPRLGLYVSLGVLIFGISLVRTDFALNYPGQYVLDNNVGSFITLEGTIIDEPDEREHVSRILVETNANGFHETTTRVLVTTGRFPMWEYGDRVVLEGVLEKPENFSSEDGREFNYSGYLAHSGVYYEMYRPNIEKTGSDHGNIVKARLFDVKHAFLDSVSQSLHEPYAALVGGLVVGAKRSLGDELLDKFRTTGLIHIVVLSGYNVTIIAYALIRMCSFMSPMLRAAVGVVSIVLFAIMTGAGATIVRASIMAGLVVIGKALGRDIDLLRLLAIAAALMILQNPLIVLHSPSFQLSFLATLGLILLPPLFEKSMTWIPEKLGLREVVLATISTQIFVLPALVYMMGDVSLVAVVVNILVLVVIPITMLLGFLTGVFGLIHPVLAVLPAYLAFIFLFYEVAVVEIFASLPFASIHVPPISLGVVIAWYVLYGYVYWRIVQQQEQKTPA